MKEIKSLTESQKSLFPKYIEKWTKIGLETNPANRELAKEGIIEAYAQAGLPAPRIVWCSSPLAMGLTRATIYELGKKSAASVGDSVWASVLASVGAYISSFFFH